MATVDIYVNPDATGTGDGTSLIDAYTSLAAAIAARATDLTVAEDVHHYHCSSSGGTADGAATVSGYTTSAAYYVIIEGEGGNNGVLDTSKYRILSSNASCLILEIQHVHVRLLQTYLSGVNATNQCGIRIASTINSRETRIERCIVGAAYNNTTYNDCDGIQTASAGTGSTYVWNCVIYGFGARTGARGIYSYTTNNTIYSYNNTIDKCGTGLYKFAGSIVAKNTIASNCASSCFSSVDGAGTDYNLSSDATAPGDNSQTEVSPSFVDAAAFNYALTTDDATARENGTDLSADAALAVSGDIIGTARPQGTNWDIGAFECVPVVTPDFTDEIGIQIQF